MASACRGDETIRISEPARGHLRTSEMASDALQPWPLARSGMVSPDAQKAPSRAERERFAYITECGMFVTSRG